MFPEIIDVKKRIREVVKTLMDEILRAERKEKLKKCLAQVIDEDILTNRDAWKIIEIMKQACEARKAELYENLVIDMIEEGDHDTENPS